MLIALKLIFLKNYHLKNHGDRKIIACKGSPTANLAKFEIDRTIISYINQG